MSAAERRQITEDNAHALDAINWIEDGYTFEAYALSDPGSELAEVPPPVLSQSIVLSCLLPYPPGPR